MYYNAGVAYLLWAVGGLGTLGFHRFYLGKIPTGVLWMCSGGLGFVGALYDFFTLSRQVREANLKAAYRRALEGGAMDALASGAAIAGPYSAPRPLQKETLEKAILRTAKKNGGSVTPGEIAIESDYSTDEARVALEKLAAKGYCEMRIRQSGVIVYRFAEFARGDEAYEPGL